MRDVGRIRTGWRLSGSFKAVSLCQKEATKALLAQAVQDGGTAAANERKTLIGESLGCVMKRVAKHGGPKATKQLHNFRKTTARRLEHKNQFDTWSGYDPTPPKLRRKPGEINGKRLGEPAASTLAVTAQRWMLRKPVVTSTDVATLGEEAAGNKMKNKCLLCATASLHRSTKKCRQMLFPKPHRCWWVQPRIC